MLFILTYALSNVTLLQGVGILYYAKHLAVYGVAGLGALWWLSSGRAAVRGRFIVFIAGVIVLALPYLARGLAMRQPGEVLVFSSYVSFAAAAVALAIAAELGGPQLSSRFALLIIAIISVVVAVTWRVAPGALFNTYWGRPRLLLGFWHPKEIGAFLACVSLVLGTAFLLGKSQLRNGLLWVALLFVLVLVDSRNMVLFNVVFAGAYLSAAYLGYPVLLVGIAAVFGAVAWFALRYPALADLISSRRLSLWQDADYTALGKGTGVAESSTGALTKFHIDNFYLEYLIENGIYTIVFAAALLLIVGYILLHTPAGRWRRLKIAAFLGLFFVSIFDAGMFSTGSIFNLVVWVYLLSAERIFGESVVVPAQKGRRRASWLRAFGAAPLRTAS